MCGITGYIGQSDSLNRDLLERMNESIVHRGPDEDGFFAEEGIGLAMRRLSIMDVHGGTQPIFNEDKSVCVVFNGEIYNYPILREALVKKGHHFASNADTEVIVHLYEEYGEEFVQHLNGMFAIALWDRKRKKAILARDRLGIKPLYYASTDQGVLFGSELKCLINTGLLNKDVDLQAVDTYFTYCYIPAPYTIYEDIFKLEPGHILIRHEGKTAIRQYWDLDYSVTHDYSESEWQDKIEEKLLAAVESHLMSDVPLGAFLSGGIDSSLIVAMMSQSISSNLDTFTMGFGGNSAAVIDERPYARLLSEKYDTNFNDFTVDPDFSNIATDIVDSFDEPFSDDSVIPSFYICMLASEKVKVAMSGLGGDELFGGYHRYLGFKLSQSYQYIPKVIEKSIIRPIADRLVEPTSGSDWINHIKRFTSNASLPAAERYLAFVSTSPKDQRQKIYSKGIVSSIDFEKTGQVITDPFSRCNAENDMDRMYYTDMKTYLPDDILALSDRLSMKHSLELRVPFLDHELVEMAAVLPDKFKIKFNNKKDLLKKISRKYLPASIIDHRKQGFESPMASWLKNDLLGFSKMILSEENVKKVGYLDYENLRIKMEEHISNKQKNNKFIFSALMFHLWAERNNITLN